ncbi:MAG: hypothetical protein Q9218_006835 [Villophora microphyllina]
MTNAQHSRPIHQSSSDHSTSPLPSPQPIKVLFSRHEKGKLSMTLKFPSFELRFEEPSYKITDDIRRIICDNYEALHDLTYLLQRRARVGHLLGKHDQELKYEARVPDWEREIGQLLTKMNGWRREMARVCDAGR